MKTIERWFQQIGDSDWTWIGFGWMRPAKEDRIGPGYVIGSSLLLGLPGIGVGAAMLYLIFGRVSPVAWSILFGAATAFELVLHILFARFWNRRAARLKH